MKVETCASRGPRTSRSEAGNPRVVLSVATETDRELIYHLRHEVYARELGQHTANPGGSLRDALDDWNVYIVAKVGGRIAGFISLTPPPQLDSPILESEPDTTQAEKSGGIAERPDGAYAGIAPDRGRDGAVSATPPSEPDGRISRIRLSGQWFLVETSHKHRSRVPD